MSQFNKTNRNTQIYDDQSSSQSLFYVNTQKTQKLKPIITNCQKRLVGNHNYWNKLQNQTYLQFLKKYFDQFEGNNKGWRMLKVYRQMSQFITTKNYAQCRIHHFRMVKQYKTTQGIIQGLQRKLRGVQGTMDKIKDYEGLRISFEVQMEMNPEDDENFWSILDAKYEDTEPFQG